MTSLARRLKLGSSTLATLAIAALAPAAAQPAGPAAPVESVTVTGTSIRGVATVGSNVINVGQQDIKATGAQTIADVLVNVPSITGMGSAGQGASAMAGFRFVAGALPFCRAEHARKRR